MYPVGLGARGRYDAAPESKILDWGGTFVSKKNACIRTGDQSLEQVGSVQLSS